MIEAIGVTISAITLLLARLDKRRDRRDEGLDVRGALIALQGHLSDWRRAALATNYAVRSWIRDGAPRDDGGMRRALQGQSVLAGDAMELFGLERRGGIVDRRSSVDDRLRRLMAIYVPELADPLEQAMQVRAGQLRELMDQLGRKERLDPGASEEFLTQLADSARALADAEEHVREFIVDHFPLEGRT